MSSTRRYSVARHARNLHGGGNSYVISYMEYLTGVRSGLAPVPTYPYRSASMASSDERTLEAVRKHGITAGVHQVTNGSSWKRDVRMKAEAFLDYFEEKGIRLRMMGPSYDSREMETFREVYFDKRLVPTVRAFAGSVCPKCFALCALEVHQDAGSTNLRLENHVCQTEHLAKVPVPLVEGKLGRQEMLEHLRAEELPSMLFVVIECIAERLGRKPYIFADYYAETNSVSIAPIQQVHGNPINIDMFDRDHWIWRLLTNSYEMDVSGEPQILMEFLRLSRANTYASIRVSSGYPIPGPKCRIGIGFK